MLSVRLRRVMLAALVVMEATLCGVGGWIFAVPFPERLLPARGEAAAPAGWLVEATLAGEDHRFEGHRGVDGWAIARAVVLDGTAPEDACTWHERVPIDRRNALLAAEACDPSQVVEIIAVRVPPRWRAWAQRRGAVRVPNDLSPLCPPRGEHHLFPWPPRHPWRIVEEP